MGFLKHALPILSCVMFTSPLWAQEAVVLPATDVQASRVSQDASYTTSHASTASKSDVPVKEEVQSINLVTNKPWPTIRCVRWTTP